MLQRVVDHLAANNEAPALPALRALAYGGGKMPLTTIERAMQLFPGVDFTNAYGLTETSSPIAVLGPDDHRAAARSGTERPELERGRAFSSGAEERRREHEISLKKGISR